MAGHPNLFPSLGSMPAPCPHAPVLFPLPKGLPVWQGTRFPSLLTQGTRPSRLKGSLQGSCVDHPPLQSNPNTGDMESPNRGAEAAAPSPSSTSTCQAFLLCLPSGTNTDRCRHRALPHHQLLDPADRAATVSSSWNPHSKAAGLGTGLDPLLSKTLSYQVVGNKGGRGGGAGNVSQGAWFLPPWQKEPWGKRSWSQSMGYMQDPHPGIDDPPLCRDTPPPEGPEELQEGKAPLSQ